MAKPTTIKKNNWFPLRENRPEIFLKEDLLAEQMSIYGVPVYYILASDKSIDKLFKNKTFDYKQDDVYEMLVYFNESEFQGEDEFLSRFNLNISKQITCTVARREFIKDIGRPPMMGDLIYFNPGYSPNPIYNQDKGYLMKVTAVQDDKELYEISRNIIYNLNLETIKYNFEKIDTGIQDIDDVYKSNKDLKLFKFSFDNTTLTGVFLLNEDCDILDKNNNKIGSCVYDSMDLINKLIFFRDVTDDNIFKIVGLLSGATLEVNKDYIEPKENRNIKEQIEPEDSNYIEEDFDNPF